MDEYDKLRLKSARKKVLCGINLNPEVKAKKHSAWTYSDIET